VEEKNDGARHEPGRLRPHLTVTVHPDTHARLTALCDKYRTTKGRLVDRLVLLLHQQMVGGKVVCLTGEVCRIGRTDVPEIF
jgi:hypothetical protein